MYNSSVQPRGFLIMGVSGSGKTTMGKALAKKLDWEFFDADDFHSAENISKMASGIPLTDSDRLPWLAELNELLLTSLWAGRHPVLACSALKESYRRQLLESVEEVPIIYLMGSYDLILARLSRRKEHYMKPEMLQSQFEVLEEPENVLVLDAAMPLDDMLGTISVTFFGSPGFGVKELQM